MWISIREAEGQLAELVRRTEAGDEVILFRDGRAVVRFVPVRPVADAASRRALLDSIRAAGAAKALPGPDAARNQDFLYGGEDVAETDLQSALATRT